MSEIIPPHKNTYGKGRCFVLAEKTKEKLGYHPNDLPEGSHKRVYVKCERCNEVFTREFRHLHQRHSCSARRVFEGVDQKWCNSCKKWLSVKAHWGEDAARYDGLQAYCKDCKKNGLCNFDIDLVDRQIVEIDSKFLKEQWERQKGRCYHTGLLLDWENKASLYSPQVERLDSSQPFNKENTVWIAKGVGQLKKGVPFGEFIQFTSDLGLNILYRPRVEVKHLKENSKVPQRAKLTDAGLDLSICEDVTVEPRSTTKMSTGIAVSVPKGYYLTIEGRSSLYAKGLIPMRGILDSTYTGEVIIAFNNMSDDTHTFKAGDRVAQLILHKVHDFDTSVVEDFSPEYNYRANNGFGSTGK